MTAAPSSALDLARNYAARLFALGDVAPVRFFGGAALRLDGVQFGMVMKDILYFRVDDENRQAFLDAGSAPFIYRGDVRDVGVATWLSAPAHILDDPEALVAWASTARDAAVRAAAIKTRRGKRR